MSNPAQVIADKHIGQGSCVDKNIRSKRSKILRTLSLKMRRDFYTKQLGNPHNVLFESENKKGFIYGFTENYVRVKTNWSFKLANTITKRRLSRIDDDGHVILEPVQNLVTV